MLLHDGCKGLIKAESEQGIATRSVGMPVVAEEIVDSEVDNAGGCHLAPDKHSTDLFTTCMYML